MEKRKVLESQIADFGAYLTDEERCVNTIKKYLHDVRYFCDFCGEREVERSLVISYKEEIASSYTSSGANSMIAALNSFFKFLGWSDLCIRQLKVQKKVYAPEEKELTRGEYERLIRCAEKKGNERISLIIQTICSSGMRVSELSFVTVEAVKRGEVTVSCKGKRRTVFIVRELRKRLLSYAQRHGILSGAIFISRGGAAIHRSTVWREMKALCKDASVSPSKVFPHNLRHLFARIFYSIDKDIAKLADILGHSSINTTRIYIMTTSAEHQRRMECMRLIV
jgi:site-specific recombinase XerD